MWLAYLSHVVGNVQVHVDPHYELDQVLSKASVLMDDGKMQWPVWRNGGTSLNLYVTHTLHCSRNYLYIHNTAKQTACMQLHMCAD